MIITPSNLRKDLLKTGMPVDPHLMATPSFSWIELLVHQKEIPSLGVLENLLKVAQILEFYKFKLFNGAYITIIAGWRSQNYQEELIKQGLTTAHHSFHITGEALDFQVKGFTIPKVFELMDKYHFGGVERTGGNWQHIDMRKQNIRFTPSGTILACHYDTIAHDKLFHKAG